MVKPVIVKREVKGTPLTYNELDTNFQNLRDSTINFTGDFGDTRSMDLNDVTSITGDPRHNIKVTVDEATESIVIDNTLGDYTKEPMGFENRTDSSISFNTSNRQFTIAPTSASYRVWVSGKEFIKTAAETITIPNTTGLYYIFFNDTGALGYQTDYFYWSSEAPIAYVYWNAVAGTSYYFADERHGIALDWATHEYLHRTRGAAYANGFVISNYTTLGTGTLDTDAQFDLSGGVFFDEDLEIKITHSSTPAANYEQDLQGPARVPVFYRSGVGGLWVKDTATDFPVKQGTSYPAYNLNTVGTWSTPDTDNNKYWAMWIVATHSVSEPVIAIMGQRQDVNIGDAVDLNTWEALDLESFPSQEFRPLYRFIFQSGGSNTPHCTLKAVLDYRQGEIREAAAVGTTTGLGEVVEDTTPQLGGDLDVNNFKIVSTSNGNIVIEPNGTGDVQLNTDTVRVGDLNSAATITTNGTGNLTLSAGGTITITPGSLDDVFVQTDTVRLGTATAAQMFALQGQDLVLGTLNTTPGSAYGSIITVGTGVNGDITLNPDGDGLVRLQAQNISIGDSAVSTTARLSVATGCTAMVFSDGINSITYSETGTTGISIRTDPGKNIVIEAGNGDVIDLDGALKVRSTTGAPTNFENGYYEDMLQTPVAWLKIDIGGSFYYLPLYQ